MSTDREEIMKRKVAIEMDLKMFQDAIREKLSKGEFDIENICGQVNRLERDLAFISNRLRSFDPYCGDESSEQDRKAIAIIGGGRGVEIRAKNDDTTRYMSRKRQTYEDIMKARRAPKSNGQSKQPQAEHKTAS